MPSRVPMACPNCRTPLKVREEYFGRVLECKKCLHPFIPSPADMLPDPAGGPSSEGSKPVESAGVMGRELSREIADFRSELARIADRIGGVEGRLESLQGEVPRLDEGIERSSAGLNEWRREVAALEARFSAIRSEFDELREQPTGEIEPAPQSLAVEVMARLEAERDRAREEIDRQRGELEALQHQNADLMRRAVEIDRRSLALESRLGSIEEDHLREVEKSTQLEEKLRELERVAANPEPAGELDRSIRQLVEEHASTRRLVDAHEEHRGSLEAGLAKLEVAQIEVDRAVGALRDRAEVGDLAVLEDRKAIRDDLRRVAGDQDDLQGRLKAAEIEQGLLQDELKRFRLDMDAIKAEAVERSERDRAEIAALRDELAARRQPAEPAATLGTVVPDPVESQVPPAPLVVGLTKASPFDFDQLAHDLLDLTPPPEVAVARTAPEVRVQPTANPVGLGAGLKPGSGEISAEMDRTRRQFAQSMAEGNWAKSIELARKMVDFSRDRFGAQDMKHALWLRNLGICLTRQGSLADARAVLLSALELSTGDLPANALPHAICLIDLGNLHVVEGDPRQARTAFQKALTIVKMLGIAPDDPIMLRAQAGLNMVTAKTANPPSFASVSITT
jgi:tetratricopeptide (TPR) repeat protein